MKQRKKECKAIVRQICDRLGEDLSSPRCAAIRNHVDHCEGCLTYLKGLETVIKLYRAYPIPPLSPKVRRDVRKRLK